MKMFGPVAAPVVVLALLGLAAPALADDGSSPLPVSLVIAVQTEDLPGPHLELAPEATAACGVGPSQLNCVFCAYPPYGDTWPWTAPRGVGVAVGPPKGPPYQYSVGVWIKC